MNRATRGEMHFEILVEELSAEAFLAELLPKLLPAEDTYVIHPHMGKDDLLRKLQGRLRGYRAWLPQDWRIVVLVDEDREDCGLLKHRLEQCALEAGFRTKRTSKTARAAEVLTRIAVEEIEAWLFGDPEAIIAAYPGVPSSLAKKEQFRDPDAIKGGTWEQLESVLQRAGHHRTGLRKIEAAKTIAANLDIDRNRSRSFRTFVEGMRAFQT